MKVGVIGIAHMHVVSYIHCFRELGVEISGAYDEEAMRLKDFCNEYQLSAFTDLDAFLELDFDTVLICSENARHHKQTLAAAKSGKHVIVEKPMALTVAEADEMIQACAEANVKLMVAHPVRYAKTMQTLKEQVEKGNIGNLVGINTTNHGKNPGGWFTQPELSGGGALIDHTIHMADLVNWMFEPEIESVHAISAHRNPDCEVEDNGLLHVRFTNGVFMSLDTSWNRPASYPVWGDASLALLTDKGFIHADGFGRKGITYTEDQLKFHAYEQSMDMGMVKAFKEAIEQDLPSPVPGEAGRFTVLLVEMAYESVAKNDVVTI